MNMLVPDRPLIAEPGKLDGELFGRRRADDLVERLMQRIVHLPARIFLKRRKARLQGKVRLIARRKKSAGVDDDADRDPIENRAAQPDLERLAADSHESPHPQ